MHWEQLGSPSRVHSVRPGMQSSTGAHVQSSVAPQCVVDEKIGDTFCSHRALSTSTPSSSHVYKSAGSDSSTPHSAGHVARVTTHAYELK
jgi:hypothetical protein